MPLSPPQDYRKLDQTHRIGLAAARPAAADVLPGTLYFSTDSGVLERSDGTLWQTYAGAGTSGGTGGGISAPPFIREEVEDSYPIIAVPTPSISIPGPAGPAIGMMALAEIPDFEQMYRAGNTDNTAVWINVPYTAGDYTASAGTWTVDAGDMVSFKYCIIGNVMIISYALNTTSVGGAASQELRVKIPGGRIGKTTDILSAIRAYDDGTDTVGFCGCVAAGNYIRNWRSGFANWSNASVNNTTVQATLVMEI